MNRPPISWCWPLDTMSTVRPFSVCPSIVSKKYCSDSGRGLGILGEFPSTSQTASPHKLQITFKMGLLYGRTHLKAWHTNFPHGRPPSPIWNPILFVQQLFEAKSPVVQRRIARNKWMVSQGRGYSAEQSTQPQTLGYSLADSPVGLLAWVYEKLHHWTDGYKWDDDESNAWFLRFHPRG